MRKSSVLGCLIAFLPFVASAQPVAIPKVSESELICFALYTVHDNTLKLTAQFYPLPDDGDRHAILQIKDGDTWTAVAVAKVIEQGWTVPFRVDDWDDTRTRHYRVNYMERAFYEGTIQKNPVDKNQITVAAFTGNSVNPAHGGDIARTDIVENVKKMKPDLLFFSGDQVYNHKEHYAHWLKFGRDFGEIIRDYPTITIPDDHDVGQPNIWGAGGKASTLPGAADGGFAMPVDYVNEVQRAQTSHLPDPYDPTPIDRGITVYYTDLTWGGISFAILEDRKWKTGPAGLIPEMGPRPDHINDPDYDPKTIDVPEAKLLGERQLDFLRHWGTDWTDAKMKAVLSQTIFAGGAHIHGKIDDRLHADLDSNGWPQAGRNRALAEIRKSFAFMIAGDQHLGSIIHHGIDDWNDAGYSFCVPSIANLYLRWWAPLEPGKNRVPDAPEYTGEFLDGFDNKITVYAVANPTAEKTDGSKLTTRAAGFGVVRFDKKTRYIHLQCWPRNTDVTGLETQQYPGWPFIVQQENNYGRKAAGYLPLVVSRGVDSPVVQVIDEENNEILYTLRIKGTAFRPKVFRESSYTVRVGEGEDTKIFEGLTPSATEDERHVTANFED